MNISYNFQWNISIINYHTSFFLLRNVIYTSCKQNREKNEKTYTSLQVIKYFHLNIFIYFQIEIFDWTEE